jgi:hypothetical protein
MRNIKKFFIKFIQKIIVFDYLYNLLGFIYFHRRLPNKTNIPDIVFRIKNDKKELSSPIRVFVSDKYLMKIFVSGVLGEGHTVPTIHITEDIKTLNNVNISETVVIKSTHSSGHIQLVQDTKVIDLDMCEKWLNENYYSLYREYNYKFLKPKIIVEPLVFKMTNPVDYKMFFFDSKFIFMQLDFDRQKYHSRMFFDSKFCPLGFSMKYPVSKHENYDYWKPDNLSEMLLAGTQLAKHFNGLIRIDFYTNGKEFYVGEITNCHGSSFEKIIPKEKEALVEHIVKDVINAKP